MSSRANSSVASARGSRAGREESSASNIERKIMGVPASIMKPRLVFVAVVFALTCFGLVMIFSASSIEALSEQGDAAYYLKRQLLCIARVMLTDPAILLLDEATSSIDTRTELQVQAAFDELMRGRTSFVVAHRLSTIRNADCILVIRDGRVIERGTHDDLLALGGFYSSLYESQFAREE